MVLDSELWMQSYHIQGTSKNACQMGNFEAMEEWYWEEIMVDKKVQVVGPPAG